MAVQNDTPDSMFAYVVVASQRARQLMAGAPPLLEPRSHKPTRVAMEELNKGMLEYETPAPPGEGGEKEGKRRKS